MKAFASLPPETACPVHWSTQVEFPSKPSVSAEAKDFIRKCLAYRQEVRWDVQTAALDPYLCLSKTGAQAAAAAAAVAAAAAAAVLPGLLPPMQSQTHQSGGFAAAGGSRQGGSSGFVGLLREMQH